MLTIGAGLFLQPNQMVQIRFSSSILGRLVTISCADQGPQALHKSGVPYRHRNLRLPYKFFECEVRNLCRRSDFGRRTPGPRSSLQCSAAGNVSRSLPVFRWHFSGFQQISQQLESCRSIFARNGPGQFKNVVLNTDLHQVFDCRIGNDFIFTRKKNQFFGLRGRDWISDQPDQPVFSTHFG